MLFNSIDFAFFLPLVFIIYWAISGKNLKAQNIFLLISSYYFYSCWDYRFLFLLIFSTCLDYFTGLKIYNATSDKGKKWWLGLSIIINLGFLAYFKYTNFFIDSFIDTFNLFGQKMDGYILNILLPVGISFYTFHGISYIIDIYRGKIKPTTNFIDYSLFVSFFPLLVAGPIERATHLLPQIQTKRKFNYIQVVDGLKQILWGLFKKLVIADNCAEYANQIFNNSNEHSGSTLLIGSIFFAFQIYGDFSGYSDIALGVARLLGIELIRNFAYPYFSRDIAEFWRRWHISLSSWFKDYLYIPLGGSKGGRMMVLRNTFIIFLVSGFWHGANWTFIIWGALNAIYFVPLLLMNKNRNNIEIVAQGKLIPSIKDVFNMTSTFLLATFAWIFFRASSVSQAIDIISEIFSKSLFTIPDVKPLFLVLLLILFISIEWIGRHENYPIAKVDYRFPKLYRWSFYYILVFCIFYFAAKQQEFIYFQF